MHVTLLLQARVEYRLLYWASRALYGQLLAAGVAIREYHRSFLHAKVAVVDSRWATVGSSNIDPYSLLMAREANVFVRDPVFARRTACRAGADDRNRLTRRSSPELGAALALREDDVWMAYGIVRVAMGMLRYGGDEWLRAQRPRRAGAATTVSHC